MDIIDIISICNTYKRVCMCCVDLCSTKYKEKHLLSSGFVSERNVNVDYVTEPMSYCE
jgi:hypothetical protein